jgi:hypothetical protein
LIFLGSAGWQSALPESVFLSPGHEFLKAASGNFCIERYKAWFLNWRPMSNPMLGIICGLVFGAISVATMLPMSFPDKPTALLAAFLNRFAIGLVIGCVTLPGWPGWAVGLVFTLLLSLPAALITQAYAPILIIGAIGGVIIGGVIHGWS